MFSVSAIKLKFSTALALSLPLLDEDTADGSAPYHADSSRLKTRRVTRVSRVSRDQGSFVKRSLLHFSRARWTSFGTFPRGENADFRSQSR